MFDEYEIIDSLNIQKNTDGTAHWWDSESTAWTKFNMQMFN